MIQSSNHTPDLQITGKADQIMSGMIEWLKSGKLSIGDKLPTEKELARTFGVSLHTVNKAMSRLEDAALISRSTGSGTHVTSIPANDAIAVICDIKHLSESFHAPSTDKLLKELVEESKRRKLIPHFLVGRGSDAEEYIQSLGIESGIWREIKGVISNGWRDGLAEKFKAKGLPMVTISTKEQGHHAITLDYRELGRLAARRLLDCGTKRICVIHQEDLEMHIWNNALSSFKEELLKASFDMNELLMFGCRTTPDDAKQALASMEAKLLSADGIFITDDNIASGLAKGLEERKEELKPGVKIVTQANKGLTLGLPENFERISFDLLELTEKSLDMLGMLRSGEMNGSAPSRTWIKPHFE